MKKGFLLIAGVALFAATSCRKNWTCTCVDSDDGYTQSIPILLQKKKDAENICNSYEYVGSTYTTTCNL
ncbi:MAG: hypothetical protein MK105_05105 [Crocinitomicaceae bacterium]|nr:hypothetical protein [Crocinitomicaceae bacterium]